MTKRREKSKATINKQLEGQENILNQQIAVRVQDDKLALEGGKFCLDVAKLVFAGVILAGIMKEDADTAILYTIGVVVVLFFVVFGFYLIKQSNKRRR